MWNLLLHKFWFFFFEFCDLVVYCKGHWIELRNSLANRKRKGFIGQKINWGYAKVIKWVNGFFFFGSVAYFITTKSWLDLTFEEEPVLQPALVLEVVAGLERVLEDRHAGREVGLRQLRHHGRTHSVSAFASTEFLPSVPGILRNDLC